jgi:hypothetical protein
MEFVLIYLFVRFFFIQKFTQGNIFNMSDSVVLVTGGSGCLGQHIVKHLQILGNDVKEIRVLDVVEYKQKLVCFRGVEVVTYLIISHTILTITPPMRFKDYY